MVEIRWTLEASRWLEEIHDYIAADNPRAATRVVNGIRGKALMLHEHPRLGARYEPIFDREVRILLYGHYRIAYVIKTEQQIDILGIFHAALEIERYLS